MAGDLLMSISQDERERAVFRSRRMYQTDLQSNLATAEDRGEQRGRKKERAEIARSLIRLNIPIEQIVVSTKLSQEEVLRLRAEAIAGDTTDD